MRQWTAVAVLLVLVGCGSESESGSGSTTTTVRMVNGTFILRDDLYATAPGEPCTGLGGYSDIGPGAQMTVTDEAGRVLGVTGLGIGRAVEVRRTSYTIITHCQFEWTVGPLPQRPFYGFEVSRRGKVTYSEADLEANGWRVELTLGSG